MGVSTHTPCTCVGYTAYNLTRRMLAMKGVAWE